MAATTIASSVAQEQLQLPHPVALDNAESVSQPSPGHIPSLKALVQKLNQEVPHILAKSHAYDNVLACFITWEDHDNPQIIESARELRFLLKDYYGYMTEEIILESSDDEFGTDPMRQFNREVSAHVDTISRKRDVSGKKPGNNLFILYYGGNGDYNSSDNKGVWFNRQIKEPSRVEWDRIEPIITLATCDILFLFDCCHATSIVPRGIECRRRCEIIGASGNVELTSDGRDNFTRALTSMLKSSITDPKTAVQLSWRLSDRDFCDKFGLMSTPQYFCLTKDRTLKSSIILAPHKTKQPSENNHDNGSKESNGSVRTAPSKTTEFKKAIMDAQQASDAYVLMAIRFTNPSENPLLDEWREWISKTPQNVSDIVLETPEIFIQQLVAETIRKSVKLQCAFRSDSALGIISVPIWLWSCLGPSPAWTFIDLIRSDKDLLEVTSTVSKAVQTTGLQVVPDSAPQSLSTPSRPRTPQMLPFDGIEATYGGDPSSPEVVDLDSTYPQSIFDADYAEQRFEEQERTRSRRLHENMRYQSTKDPPSRRGFWHFTRPPTRREQENPRIEKLLRKRGFKDSGPIKTVGYHSAGIFLKLEG